MASRQQAPGLVLAALLALGGQVSPAAAADPPDYEELRRAVAADGFSAQACPEAADTFGQWVARQRETETRRAPLIDSRELGERIHGACREGIRSLELSTNQDEGALEALYRSELWYAINRALASLRYWQAWLDLSLAQHAADSQQRLTDLSRARRGFEASALRILYPGVVYGSWLGLAYVAQLEGDEAGMQRRLELLQQALASDPDNPLQEIVATELGLIALRLDDTGPIQILPGAPLTATTARLAEERAFQLLARRREQGSGGTEAAGYLQQLIDQGFLDDRLFARILAFRDEVVGHDIGPLGLLVDAEFAYAYQQYESNVLKFRQFLASKAAGYPLNLTAFLYHYAVSLYQIGLSQDAMAVVEELRASAGLPAELQAPLAKLKFIVAEGMYRDRSSRPYARRLESAAQDYIAAAPADPDIASAHMALARVAGNDGQRAQHLRLAAADSRLEGSVRAVELEAALARFQSLWEAGDPAGASAAARSALALLEDLPGDQRHTLQMQVLAVQLRSILAQEAGELLAELDALYANPALNATQRRVLMWSRLRLLDRLEGPDALREFVHQLPPAGADSILDNELYVLLRELETQQRSAELAGLCALWLPQLAPQPQLQRQVWLMQVKALRGSGQDAEALAAVQALLAAFPNSGDAWEQLAQQSAATGDSFAAERALAHIAAAEPEGSPRWLEVSLQRLQLLLASEAGASRGCSLYKRIRSYGHRLEQGQQQMLADLVGSDACRGQGED